ncbi:DsbA family oxidoreductase [Ramlibacter albus]|uniref:DsbA family oxidoreductase n=1 Tax=Ramlibacter albus TaxID=2079448 RepID=A0A923M9V6_9BURK|nr:DsbA family oxidoreductase [Ramlibacter albus]MBC5766962.1 DsbA family oxidoreductase [Ramlibacter albus]
MKTLKIDFVSDVACPWCAIGLASLEQALQRVEGDVKPEIHFQPFELNPQMGPEGQDVTEHLTQKYGSTPQQQALARENIRQRGAALGFEFRAEGRGRIWNTFDAHRLLHWAGLQSPEKQHALKKVLLKAYHGEARNPSDHEVLLAAAKEAGLDEAEAKLVLESGRYANQVREAEQVWTQNGIHAVPSIILDDKWLIQGGQPPEILEQAIRQAVAEQGA